MHSYKIGIQKCIKEPEKGLGTLKVVVFSEPIKPQHKILYAKYLKNFTKQAQYDIFSEVTLYIIYIIIYMYAKKGKTEEVKK